MILPPVFSRNEFVKLLVWLAGLSIVDWKICKKESVSHIYATTRFESTFLLSIGINIVNRDTNGEETHQGRHTHKIDSDISLSRVKKATETAEEEREGKVNEH